MKKIHRISIVWNATTTMKCLSLSELNRLTISTPFAVEDRLKGIVKRHPIMEIV